MEREKDSMEGWAILELMGHRRLGGLVSEHVVAGASMVRIDVPAVEAVPGFTQFYSPAAVYCITPTTEEIAKAIAANGLHRPVDRYELPRLSAAPDDVDGR